MPRGYRYAILALVGLLVAASPPRDDAQRKEAKAQQRIAKRLGDIATALQKANEPEAPDTGCAKGEDNRQSDLCAQWKAADAAAESTLWAERTFYLGIGGLIVGLLTLGAAGAAAKYARDAARHTDRGATEAERSVVQAKRAAEIAKASARRQLRAYLGIEKAEIVFGDDAIRIDFVIRNYGPTPASDVTVEVLQTGSFTNPRICGLPFGIIDPSAVDIGSLVIHQKEGISGNTLADLIAEFVVAYEDTYGRRWERQITFEAIDTFPNKSGIARMRTVAGRSSDRRLKNGEQAKRFSLPKN